MGSALLADPVAEARQLIAAAAWQAGGKVRWYAGPEQEQPDGQ